MYLPTSRDQTHTRGTAFGPWLLNQPAVSLVSNRTTLTQKNKLPQQQHTENNNAEDFPPAQPRVEAEVDEDSLIGEADRPSPTSEKPEA